jgi:hypothetical protein
MNPELLKRLRPLYGNIIDRLWLEYQLADDTRRRELDAITNVLAYKQLGIGIGEERLLLEPPHPDLIGDGEYTIGNVIYPGVPAYPFRVRRNELLRHVFILGPSGTGKSTLIISILQQLLADHMPFMAFDFKRNYRTLKTAPHGEALLVFTVGRNVAPLCVNVLRPPPGVDTAQWVEALADIVGTAYLLLHGARNVLKDALLYAIEKRGNDATLLDAYHAVQAELGRARSGSRRYGWLESTTRSLQELSTGPFGAALTNDRDDVKALCRCPAVFELETLGDDQKRFFCLWMLQVVLAMRKHDHAPREQLQHVLVFDEAHNVFPKDQYGELGVPSRLAREVREYGEAIIAATQQGDVADSLIANSGFKIFLRCDFPKDVELASHLLQVDAKWLPKLPMGYGIARFPVRHYTPFLFHFAEQPLKNVLVTDTDIRTTVSPLPAAPVSSSPAVSEREHALLLDILEYPIAGITERYERLGWNASGNKIKDQVLANALAYFDPVSTPTGRVKILCLTESGTTLLAHNGHTRPAFRHGGAAHEYWRQRMTKLLETRGYTVTHEYAVGKGCTVDVHATRDGHEVFVEVETGKSDVAANVSKCAQLPGRVLFLFTSQEGRQKHEALCGDLAFLIPEDLRAIDTYLARR